VVRLLCYDILHVACAEKFLLAYPAHTAPDGFFCPACHGPFFPPEMTASPVADQLRRSLEGMKDLQKRLQGLSAVAQDHSKTSPPTDRRPEPEGKEGHGEADQGTLDAHEQEAGVQDIIEYNPSSKDELESDSLSSASDFIATHPGFHPRSVDDVAADPTLHSPKTENVNHVAPLNEDASVNATLPMTAFDTDLASRLSPDVVVEVAEAAPTPSRESSPLKSVTIPMVDSSPVTHSAWTLADSSPTSAFVATAAMSTTAGFSSSSALQSALTPSYSRPAPVAEQHYPSSSAPLPFAGKKFDLWDFSRLPQSAATSPAGKYGDSHHQYGASVRSSSSSYSGVPRVAHSFSATSFPRPEDHDDHKYRRKPIMEVIRTWLKIFSPPRGRRTTPSLWRRFVIIVLIALLSLIGLVLLFHHMGRSGREDDDDPLLDLKANPFVKVDDS